MDVNNLIDNLVTENKPAKDQEAKHDPRGRKNRGDTAEHYEEYKKSLRDFKTTEQPPKFKSEIIERVAGEVVEPENLEQFRELYKLTCFDVLETFEQDNQELIKKPVFYWYKRVLLKIKENTPKITADEPEKMGAVWDVLKEFLAYIGLYITFETFQNITGIYKYQIEDRAKLSPKHAELLKKILIERDSALVNELQYNPYNQTNKMFIAKVHGIIEKTEPKQVEVTHHMDNYGSISAYRLQDHDQVQDDDKTEE